MLRNEVSARRTLEAMVFGALDSGTACILDGSLCESVGDLVDQTSTSPRSPEDYLAALPQRAGLDLLDFGCGTAEHRPMLERLGFRWKGVNYEAGMQRDAARAAKHDPEIVFYDGLTLPFEEGAFDVVYSSFTFQCVQRIDRAFSEIHRVLKPGGVLIGSVAYMEQMQDYTTFNFTPYGFKLSCDMAGLALEKISGRYDIFTWMMRRLLILTSGSDENTLTDILKPQNAIGDAFDAYGRRLGLSPRDVNLLRLQFSAHFSFQARK